MSREPVLECRGLTVGYDEEAPVLQDLDLVIHGGEIVTILGSSGCGKSTLLRTVIGLLPPIGGEVRVFGVPIYEASGDERDAVLRRTGVMFQQDALFASMTVLDNVALPLRELTQLPEALIVEMARMRLALVGLAGFEARAPSTLSGGQRKRAALARASVLDPELIFCDEPSAGLDPVIAAGIDDVLRDFRSALGITVVAISHELESIKAISDRAIMLAGGGVKAAGTIDELATSLDPDVHDFFHRVAERPDHHPRAEA